MRLVQDDHHPCLHIQFVLKYFNDLERLGFYTRGGDLCSALASLIEHIASDTSGVLVQREARASRPMSEQGARLQGFGPSLMLLVLLIAYDLSSCSCPRCPSL